LDRNEYIELRFDLSQVEKGSIANATLELTAFQSMSNQTLRVYGLEHAAAGQNWNEATIEFAGAPGLTFDGNSVTRGRVDAELLLLGEFSTGTKSEGDTASFTNPDLTVFLNLLSYRGEGPENVVTLLVERQNSSNAQALFASKEATQLASSSAAPAGTYAPRLVLDAIFEAVEPILSGDYNDDGVVDAADYTEWRNHLGGTGPLPNETESLGSVDQADYDAWKANFGATVAGSGSGRLAPSTVPEPSAWISSLGGVLALIRARCNAGSLRGTRNE
jgi:hypothetical protein